MRLAEAANVDDEGVATIDGQMADEAAKLPGNGGVEGG